MRLFVARLPSEWKDNDLLKFFAPYGATSARVIFDKTSGRSKCLAFVEIPDAKLAAQAISEKNFSIVDNNEQRILVSKAEEPRQKHPQAGKSKGPGQAIPHSRSKGEKTTAFPYRFSPRDAGKRSKPPFHDKLDSHRYDVAFEVDWVTKTPVAANPFSDPDPQIKPCCPDSPKHNEYTGYDKRWLRVGGRLAISPFTVKSAIANGFANLLGGCIRVPSEKDPHSDQGEGKYPYKGGYKRYRVGMQGQSKPGIIKSIKDVDGGREFEIEVVEEEVYYGKDSLPFPIAPGTEVVALIEPNPRQKKKPWIIVKLEKNANQKKLLKPGRLQKIRELIYHGPYSWGMKSYRGKKPWRHRFYTLPHSKQRAKGTIPIWQFETLTELESRMFMGRDQKNKPPNPNYRWFQKIDDLKVGDWVYYEIFNGAITNIGKNFLFKAPFYHPDTVPSEQSECDDIMGSLCPRCAMFGMTDKKKKDNRPAVGYRGRFKASALVCHEILKEVQGKKESLPVTDGNHYKVYPAPIKAWSNGNDIKCRQFLLPIQGQPKPNKRDVDGYFDPVTGFVKGIKTYRHSLQDVINLKHLEDLVSRTDTRRTLADMQPTLFVPNDGERKRLKRLEYSHNMRSWAEVCDEGMTFQGTLGAENCSEDEIAAIVLLLDVDVAGHGFKIGTGKALGLGSVESHIKRLWIRKPDKYEWVQVQIEDFKSLDQALRQHLPEVKAGLEMLKKVDEFGRKVGAEINPLERKTLPLAYPPPGMRYWDHARDTGLNDMP